MIFVLLLLVPYFLWIYQSADQAPIAGLFMLLMLFFIASFVSLTVSIDQRYLRIKFGYGIYRKRFSLAEIASFRIVKNRWYYGWGIRRWLRPPMWIFNVSGFDAVEIVMQNGQIYRLGTDEPRELERAIKQALAMLPTMQGR